MKTIKIIDLLNKIANGEEVPKEIKIKMSGGRVAPFYQQDYDYINNYTGQTLLECLHEFDLNNEVEIIEEEKEIEEFETTYSMNMVEMLIQDKLNELIDVVNELKRDK